MEFPTPSGSLPVSGASQAEWMKIDFHLHTSEDPEDCLEYSAVELLQRAHELGFHALAITLHGRVLSDEGVFATARGLGIRLIPAAELRLDGADVVVVNLTQEEALELRSLRDLEAFRQRRGGSALIIAPHPYFVLGGSMGRRLVEYIDLFDAIEISHFHTRWFDRNRPAVAVAERFRKPLIATSDAHRLLGFGQHYSWVQAPADASPEGIFNAVRRGGVRAVSPALTTGQFAGYFWWICVEHELYKLRQRSSKRG
ncbi:MAG: PHP-associated domain-containing protein [Verrucomicrobiota bacterium]